MMRYRIAISIGADGDRKHVLIDNGQGGFTSFTVSVGNSVYDSFLESQSLTDAEVQAMKPDVWHDMA